jgi:hydroxymethylbilane synthase
LEFAINRTPQLRGHADSVAEHSMASLPRLRIGTRGSPLALAQTHMVRDLLCKLHGFDKDDVAIKIIKTTGDQVQNQKLSEIGGKGLFTKEIEIALVEKEIDLAVHSAKDMPTTLPEGLAISACPRREDARDALICHKAQTFDGLVVGAKLGTASLRREAQVRRIRPDIRVQPLRGNVETRLRKVRDGEVDATILGMAGLRRLGLTDEIAESLSTAMFLPAVGQGTVAIEACDGDAITRDILIALDHTETSLALAAERAFLSVLEGSCRTPIAGYAEISGADLHFRGLVMRPDGSESYETARHGAAMDAIKIGADAAAELKAKLSPGFFAAVA